MRFEHRPLYGDITPLRGLTNVLLSLDFLLERAGDEISNIVPFRGLTNVLSSLYFLLKERVMRIRILPPSGGSRMLFRVYISYWKERVMRFELTNGTLGRYCLTTWRHPPDVEAL